MVLAHVTATAHQPAHAADGVPADTGLCDAQAAKIKATLDYERQQLGKQSVQGAEKDLETFRGSLAGLEAEQEAAQEATQQAQAQYQEQVGRQ